MTVQSKDLTEQVIAPIAARRGIPPSVVLGFLLSHPDLTDEQIRSAGLNPDQARSNPAQMADAVAQLLSQSFKQTGDWHAATALSLGHDAADAQNPTSPAGGEVNSVLGIAAAKSDFGLTFIRNSKDISPAYLQSAHAFSTGVMKPYANLGGVITSDAITQFEQCTQYVWNTLAWTHQMGSYPNASGWLDRGAQHGLKTGNVPVAGAVVVWGAGEGGAGDVGHVAVVDRVNPDGTFTVGESNWPEGSTPHHGRVVSVNQVAGFMYAPGGPHPDQNPQPNVQQAGATKPQNTGVPEHNTRKDDPPPGLVASFAKNAMAKGLTPEHFTDTMEKIAPLTRYLLGKPPTLEQIAVAHAQPPEVWTKMIRDTPHPKNPSVTAGAVADAWDAASLHSTRLARRFPTVTEAGLFAGAGFKSQDIQAYYQDHAPADMKQPEPQQDNVIPMAQKRQGQGQRSS